MVVSEYVLYLSKVLQNKNAVSPDGRMVRDAVGTQITYEIGQINI
jgi:hypothetical protein